MKKRILLISAAILLMVTSYATSPKVSISLTGSQLLINKQPIDSSTTTQKVQQIMGAEHPRRLDGGTLGFWYVYDESALTFRWNADSTRLQYVYIAFQTYDAHPVYEGKNTDGFSFSYLGAAVDMSTSIFTMVKRSQGHIRSIKSDLFGISIEQGNNTMQIVYRPDKCIFKSKKPIPDGPYTPDEHDIQYIRSCTIFPGGGTAFTQKCPDIKFVHDSLYTSGRPAPEEIYVLHPDFLHEPFDCEKMVFMRAREPLEYIFNTTDEDSLKRLVVYYSARLKDDNQVKREYEGYKEYDEDAINADGYSLLRDGNFAGATALFKLNTILYPDSYNVWDSYGEVLFADGHPEEAAKMYRLSLDKNPRNTIYEWNSAYNSLAFLKLILGRLDIYK